MTTLLAGLMGIPPKSMARKGGDPHNEYHVRRFFGHISTSIT